MADLLILQTVAFVELRFLIFIKPSSSVFSFTVLNLRSPHRPEVTRCSCISRSLTAWRFALSSLTVGVVSVAGPGPCVGRRRPLPVDVRRPCPSVEEAVPAPPSRLCAFVGAELTVAVGSVSGPSALTADLRVRPAPTPRRPSHRSAPVSPEVGGVRAPTRLFSFDAERAAPGLGLLSA